MAEKLFIVMRGVPGSGKSTWLVKNYPHAFVVSADTYLYQPDGRYVHDIKKLGQAHRACERLCLTALVEGVPVVAFDNTNIERKHFVSMIRHAETERYKVRVVRMMGRFQNIHGAPEELIETRLKAFQPHRLDELTYP